MLQIAVRVKPGSKQPGISVEDGTVVLRVRERAVEGAANAACVKALAEALGVAPAYVLLLHGARGREKRFCIEGIEETLARRRLGLRV